MRPAMEPYRIKVVEPLSFSTPAERRRALERCGYNLFNLGGDEITIDLLTDSGTSAQSTAQWAAMIQADEAYAGARSFQHFEHVVRDLTSYTHIIPAHQGRAAERILFSNLLQPGELSLSNTHFDTTRANIELCRCEARDLPCAESADLQSDAPFKGNVDTEALDRALKSREGARVGIVTMTITNNAGGGQPVSMANLAAVSALCREAGVPLILDAARFAENAWLVIQREPGWGNHTPRDVAAQAFALADGCIASLKKDGIGNIGGLLAVNDDALAERCKATLIATEGFPTYGGLAGRDLEALAVGLTEVLEPDYLRSRADTARYFAELLNRAGVPTVRPAGCHAVYIDAGALLPHIPSRQFPAHALACEIYLEGGIRGADLGTLTFGRPGQDGASEICAPHELLRLALPRRVYTHTHLSYVADVVAAVAARAASIPGYRIVDAPPALRHFTARLEPVHDNGVENLLARPEGGIPA